MNEACAAGILAAMRPYLEQQWRGRVGDPDSSRVIVQANVLLALIEFWRYLGLSDWEVVNQVERRLIKVEDDAFDLPLFSSKGDERRAERLRAYALYNWALPTQAWIFDRETEAIPDEKRFADGKDLLYKVFPLWPFMVRRAWCRRGVGILEQVFRFNSADAGDVIESRVRRLLRSKHGPNGYHRWYLEARAFLPPSADDPDEEKRLAKMHGRKWWKIVQMERKRLLSELGGHPPRNLKPPIPVERHDFRDKIVLLEPGVNGSTTIHIPPSDTDETEAVIPGDYLVLPGTSEVRVVKVSEDQEYGQVWTATVTLSRPAK